MINFVKMSLKNELQDIISGISRHSEKSTIQAAAHILRESSQASRNSQKTKLTKEQEAEKLINWAQSTGFWFLEHNESSFIAQGAEQRVYLYSDPKYVYKLNDGIFYAKWLDYFHSLLVHNYFFPQTAYQLIGFYIEENIFYAVVKQSFIEITQQTDLNSISYFLNANGFQLKRYNDYYNKEIGIILEDLHDENVLTQNGVLFFIDTIFYLTDSFYSH